MIRFGTPSYAIAFGALNGAALAILLLRTHQNRAANRVLATLLAVLVLRLVPYVLGYAGYYDAYPWLSFAPFDLPLAIGPLLWLYVERLTSDRLPPRWWVHLLPAAAHLVAWSVIFALASLEQKNAIATVWIDPLVAPAITFGALVSLAAYGWRAFMTLQRYQRWLDDHLSNREEFRLTWLRRLLGLFATLGVAWLFVASVDAFVRPLSYYDEFPFYVFQGLLAWVMGLLAWRDAELRYPAPEVDVTDVTSSVPEPDLSSGRGPDWSLLGREYLEAIRANGWWKDSQLTLSSLARHLATNTSYLSKALNQGLGQNFNECINRLRVEAVALELRNGSRQDLVQLGFDAGFNSKASFQRAFSQYMQQTPSTYRAQVQRTGPPDLTDVVGNTGAAVRGRGRDEAT